MQDVEIHYLTKKTFAGLLINNPYISKVHCLEANLNDTIDILQKENFDCIIDLHKNIRTFRVKMKMKVPSFTFNKLNIEKWLLVKLKL